MGDGIRDSHARVHVHVQAGGTGNVWVLDRRYWRRSDLVMLNTMLNTRPRTYLGTCSAMPRWYKAQAMQRIIVSKCATCRSRRYGGEWAGTESPTVDQSPNKPLENTAFLACNIYGFSEGGTKIRRACRSAHSSILFHDAF